MAFSGKKTQSKKEKSEIDRYIHKMLKKIAIEVSPVQPDVVTQFERNYLGIPPSKISESKELVIPDNILLNSAKFRNRPLPIKDDEVGLIICKAILKSVLFRTLNKRQLVEVITVMKERRVVAQEMILKGFEKNNKFYIVEHGVFRTWSTYPTLEDIAFVTLYKRFDNFGEMGLIYDVTNDMSVQAVSDGILWYIDRERYNRILLGPSTTEKQLNRQLIETTQIFRKLPPQDLDELVDYFFPRIYDEGDCIFYQNDPAIEVYILESGKVEFCIVGPDSEKTEISTVPPGDIFGETAIKSEEPRLFSAYAKERSRVLVITTETLIQVVGYGIRSIQDYAD